MLTKCHALLQSLQNYQLSSSVFIFSGSIFTFSRLVFFLKGEMRVGHDIMGQCRKVGTMAV